MDFDIEVIIVLLLFLFLFFFCTARLATPLALLVPLLDAVALGHDDVLYDIGCGDGRVLVEAARTFGVRCVGVERDARLCRDAVAAADAHGVSDLVTIHQGDAGGVPVDGATVVFLFIPVKAINQLLPALLERLSVGARVIAHEQARQEWRVQPNRSVPVFGDAAMTVAHLWEVKSDPIP